MKLWIPANNISSNPNLKRNIFINTFRDLEISANNCRYLRIISDIYNFAQISLIILQISAMANMDQIRRRLAIHAAVNILLNCVSAVNLVELTAYDLEVNLCDVLLRDAVQEILRCLNTTTYL